VLALHWLQRRLRRRAPRTRSGARPVAPPPLRALTAAALALPGLAQRAQAAGSDGFDFQYGRYQESDRNLYGVDSAYAPLEVDSLLTSGRVTLFDRLKVAMSYVQDTWSGATPIATAPLVVGGNRSTAPDGVSGATPYLQGDLYLDAGFRPLEIDEFGAVVGTDDRAVHTLSSASPETRQEVDVDLGWEWNDAALHLGGGASFELDYEAWFVDLGGRWDLDAKRTSLSLDLSYTHGDTQAILDHDAVPYIDTSAYRSQIEIDPASGDRTLSGDSHEWGTRLSLTHILGRNSVVELDAGYVHSSGYLANPYRVVEVAFIDPEQQFLAPPGGYYSQVRALLEELPERRNQWSVGASFVQYVPPLDASLHLGYRFYHDDWGIDAHTFEASWAQPLPYGFLVTPRFRYYSQSAADFYVDYLISQQAYATIVSDPDTGDIVSITPFDRRLLPSYFSSDARLSGFGALGGGVTLSRNFARGILLTGDFEYYAHQGSLKLGGGGERSFADYNFYRFGAALSLDSSALHAYEFGGSVDHATHGAHAYVPAGVMLGHMLPRAGALMAGFHYMWSRRSGDMLHGSRNVDDAAVIAGGCEGSPCRTAPKRMDMDMAVLELMGAPTDWLNLMLSAPFVAMDMDLRRLEGGTPDIHGTHGHSTGGVGDLSFFALLRLLDREGQHVHWGLGLSAPTGDVNLRFRRTHQEDLGFVHYDMQLGSGTWDLLPSLTYTGRWSRWGWGGQLSGIKRLQDENRSGYALGDRFQATAWASASLASWLSLSARAIYTNQGEIVGRYDGQSAGSGPMDFPENYGGRFWDVGLGIGAVVPSGYLAGNRLRVEWLQPVRQDVNGYQLERRGTLAVAWSIEF
jgi:hypothetical protein